MLPAPVLTVNRNRPSWVISTQHGAVCRSANGEAPIGDRLPSGRSRKAEMVPVPVLCALDTNSWLGLVGRNSLPNGPRPWARNGDPGAAVRRPPGTDGEAVDLGGSDPGADELAAGAVEQHVAGLGCVGQRHGRAGDRGQAAAAAQPEAGVVAAAGAGVGHVHQAAVDGDADRQRAARTTRRPRAPGGARRRA